MTWNYVYFSPRRKLDKIRKADKNYIFSFGRLGQRLNLTFERTPESCIYQSVQHLAAHLPPGVTVEDYTATESHVLEGITGNVNLSILSGQSAKAISILLLEICQFIGNFINNYKCLVNQEALKYVIQERSY